MTNGQRELVIRNLHVKVEDREILKGIDLAVQPGKVHAIMGPNGSGKSTLAYTMMGHPGYEVTQGEILVDGVDITEMSPDDRAKEGVFLAFQYPHSIPGVTMANFLRTAVNAVKEKPMSPKDFRQTLREQMKLLKMSDEFAGRFVNEGFSGGEKKRAEILQMAMLQPKYAVLDETDSGLDIDALRIVADGVNAVLGPDLGVLVITHYQRLLNYIKPDYVHVLVHGKMVAEGGPELALELEKRPGKKAIVLLTDGGDNASVLTREAAVRRARATGIPVFAIAEGDALSDAPSERLLHELAESTGGRLYKAKRSKDLLNIFADISSNLRSGYLLAFQPPEDRTPALWHELQVLVKDPGLPVTIRARTGYPAQ